MASTGMFAAVEHTSLQVSEKHDEKHDANEPPSSSSPPSLQTTDPSPAPSADEPEAIRPSGPRLWLTLANLSLVIILGGLDFSIVAVAVPSITAQFHSLTDVGWYGVSYRLTACVTQFAWGHVYGLVSARRALAAAIVLFLAGSALSSEATSSAMFIAGRAVTGIGSAGVLGGTFAALSVVAPLRLRPILTSLLGALEASAMVLGPIIGGLLAQDASWRWCFRINLPIGGLALACLLLCMPDGYEDNDPAARLERRSLTARQVLHKLDLVSNTVLTGALVCLFLALTWAGTRNAWASATVIGLLAGFIGLLCVFACMQYVRGDAATLPPRILAQRSVLAGALFSVCLNGALNVLEYYIPIYFQAVRGWTPARAGYMMLPVTVGFNLGLVLQGAGTSWLGYYTPFMLVAAVVLPVGAGLVTTWTVAPPTGIGRLIFYTGMVGFGSGLAFEAPQIAVQTVLPEEDGALGLAVTLFAQNFGSAVFIAAAQQIFTAQLLDNLAGKVPGLNATTVQNLGLTNDGLGTTNLTSATEQEILDGMQVSFVHTWYLPLALACLMIVGSAAMEWRSVKDDKSDQGEER